MLSRLIDAGWLRPAEGARVYRGQVSRFSVCPSIFDGRFDAVAAKRLHLRAAYARAREAATPDEGAESWL
jgi:hypothetical protein